MVSNPEFLREGEAIRDFTYPDRILIGTADKKSIRILKNLYEPLISKGAKFINTPRRAAELIKYSSNAFLATEISNLCEKSGVNIEDISIGMGLDMRIGSRFLRPGPAYGGSCFPKDTKALVDTADKFKTNLSVIKSVVKSNKNRPLLLLKRIGVFMKGQFKNKNICFLGVTFKANTDDMRDSSCLKMIPSLLKKGAIINYYDPTGYKSELSKYKNVSFAKDIKSAISIADLIIIHTEWNAFKSINFKSLLKNKNSIIFDLRNIYSSSKMKKLNIKYYSIGQ